MFCFPNCISLTFAKLAVLGDTFGVGTEVFTEGDYHGTLSFPTVVQISDSLFVIVEVVS